MQEDREEQDLLLPLEDIMEVAPLLILIVLRMIAAVEEELAI